MTDLKEYIKEKRPSLSASSLTTYTSVLRSLYKKVFGDGEINKSKFEETDKILNHLKDLPPNKRKTILSALVIITDDKKYRDLMLEDIRDYSKEVSKQEKTETQKENWVESSQIRTLWETLKHNASLLYKKGSLTPNDLQAIQSFVIVSLVGGIFVPPRRAKDLVDWKIRNIDRSKDNYLEKSSIHYNSYKTAKTYGEQVIPIPPALKTILTKWMKVNPTDWLLFDTNQNKLTSVKLNQRLNKIFEGKISVNQMRHTYLTDKYAETAKVQQEMEKDFEEMGSSKAQEKVYIKTDG
jgi:integrase